MIFPCKFVYFFFTHSVVNSSALELDIKNTNGFLFKHKKKRMYFLIIPKICF